jgi:hypothetical protein
LKGGSMKAKLRRMTLQKILERHGIHTIRRLRELTGLSSQQCWNLWWGKAGVGRRTMQLLHDRCNIPFDELASVDPVPRRPSPSKHQSKDNPTEAEQES